MNRLSELRKALEAAEALEGAFYDLEQVYKVGFVCPDEFNPEYWTCRIRAMLKVEEARLLEEAKAQARLAAILERESKQKVA